MSDVISELEAEQLYRQALSRIQDELGWSPGEAHRALAQIAAGHGVFLHDVALAVLSAPSLKLGMSAALRQVVLERRPFHACASQCAAALADASP
jgi:hypothetical protein